MVSPKVERYQHQTWETMNADYYLKPGLRTGSKLIHFDTPWENLEVIIKTPLSQ